MTLSFPPARICFPFAGGIVGGSHISAIKLIQSLDRQRFIPEVVVHHAAGQVGELLRDEAVPFHTAPTPFHFGRAPGVWQPRGVNDLLRASFAQRHLAAFLQTLGISIVHTNEGAMHATWAVPAWLAGTKLLWHHRSSPEARGLRVLAPRFADHVVGVSHFALSEFRARRHDVPTTVIHSPFDTSIAADRPGARAALLAELGLSADTVVIGYFGNFVDRKRPLLFVDVIAELAQRAPTLPITGVMFGETLDAGLDQQVVQRARGLGIAKRLHLMGFRYPATNWLAACDVLAVTAVGEPFGRTLIEAMLLGTAVVAVASGGNLEAISDDTTGVLARVDDAGSIATKILALLQDPARLARITAAAGYDAKDKFGQERHRLDIETCYRDLLASPPSTARSQLYRAGLLGPKNLSNNRNR